LKICDFGLAKITDPDSNYYATNLSYLPVRWTAPESISKKKFSKSSDIHSLVIVFFEIVTDGCIPYGEGTTIEVVQKILDGQYPSIPNDTDEKLINIVKNFYSFDPEKRPTIEEIETKLKQIK